MLRLITVILSLMSMQIIAQELPDNAAEALNKYVKMRESFKHSSTKQFSRDEQFQMDDWCFDMEKKFPDAYETDFAWYLNGHFYDERKDKLMDAYAKAPNNESVIKAVFGYYFMKNDLSAAKGMISKVSRFYSANELSYYGDAMPTAGYYIVSSNVDAIPLYIRKLNGELTSSAQIVNMDFLINDSYRKRFSAGLKTGDMKFFGAEKEFLKKAMNSSKTVQLSATVSQSYLDGNEENCFLIGLGYQSKTVSQLSSLEKFWDKVAKRNFSSLSLNYSEKKLYTNYLPPLLTLYRLNLLRGKKDDILRKAIVALAEKVGQTKKVNTILEDYE